MERLWGYCRGGNNDTCRIFPADMMEARQNAIGRLKPIAHNYNGLAPAILGVEEPVAFLHVAPDLCAQPCNLMLNVLLRNVARLIAYDYVLETN